MPGGGFCKLPGGSVVVALGLPSPAGDGSSVRILVHAVNRPRALTRLRNLGLRAVYLRGNTHPPTPDEVTAVLHHPDGLLWRALPQAEAELWHPIRALPRRPPAGRPLHPSAPRVPDARTAAEGRKPGALGPYAADPRSDGPLGPPGAGPRTDSPHGPPGAGPRAAEGGHRTGAH